jgi:hypothetical protein
MTNLRRFDLMCFFWVLLLFPMASQAQKLPPIAEQVAKTFGIDAFNKVDGIRYTFAARLPGALLSRSWEWHPKTDTVSFAGKDKSGKLIKVTYRRSDLSSQSDAIKNVIDPAFLNDEYWLIFPFHVVWDGAAVTDDGSQKLPIGKGAAERISVRYGSNGYSPGDTWELYIGPNKRVAQMIFRRGGAKKPSVVIMTWTGYKRAGALLFSTAHRGTADGKPVQISLSSISVNFTGSRNWVAAR